MTPAEWTRVLDALVKAEAVEAHQAGRLHRDPHGLRLAQEAVRALRATVATAAPVTAALSQPEQLEWASVPLASRVLRISYYAARRRAERGLDNGTARRVGKHLELHLPSQREAARG